MLGFTAAIFHLVTHAFFKALLFLGAGSVMHSMGGVIDMRRFGGLRRIMPITAATFLIGSLALAGVAPFAGFFSKDEILAALHGRGWPGAHGEHHEQPASGHAALTVTPDEHPSAASLLLGEGRAAVAPASAIRFVSRGTASPSTAPAGGGLDSPRTWQLLFWMSLVTAGLTAFYTFRAVFMTFTGPTRVPDEAGHHAHESPPVMTLPLVILAAASAVSGWWLFRTQALAGFLASTPSLTCPTVADTAVPWRSRARSPPPSASRWPRSATSAGAATGRRWSGIWGRSSPCLPTACTSISSMPRSSSSRSSSWP